MNKGIKALSVYVVERNKMLEKRSVEEFDLFIEKFKHEFDKEFVEKWAQTTDEVKTLTLCKMICNVKTISSGTKEWARSWLKEHNYSEVIW